MRSQRISADEQFRLIMECRASGLSDCQWCLEHDIKPGTFYNWVKRLRKSGCVDIPVSSRNKKPEKHEVVQITFDKPTECVPTSLPKEVPDVVWDVQCQTTSKSSAMELTISGSTLRIPNGTDPFLLEQTIRLLRVLSC